MSSKSSSSQQQSTSQADNRAIGDNGATIITGSSGVTVNQSDMGLIQQAFDYFKGKDAYAAAAQEALITTASKGFESIIGAGDKFLSVAATAADPAAQQSRFEMMLLALGAIFLFVEFRKS